MPHRLGARWRLGRVLDLEACAVGVANNPEELRYHAAPELVNLAQAEAVQVCRVAELVRVNVDAKQTRP